MDKGDVVLIPFPYTDLTGNKYRPAIILVESEDDVIVCFITSQLKWQSEFDIFINPTEINGLKKPSLIRLNKIATIDKELIVGRLGLLDKGNPELLNENLKHLLKLL
jgi:mRNA interferase MazF